jgi:hypothetical protein
MQVPSLSSGCEIAQFFVRHTAESEVEFDMHITIEAGLASMWETTFARLTHAGLGKDLTTRHAY